MLRLRTGILGSLCALLMVSSLSAQTFIVPNELQMPGTQPTEPVDFIVEPFICNGCHGNYDSAVEPGHNWGGSMMAQATRDPVFWAATAIAEQNLTGAGDLCLRCHTPSGWIGGRSTPTDGSILEPFIDGDGISCNVCHRITNPDTSEFPGIQNHPFLAHDEAVTPTGYVGAGQYVLSDQFQPMLGPYADALPLHNIQKTDYTRSSDMCGTCHDVSNPYTGDLAANNGAATPLAPGTFSGVLGSPVDTKAAFNNPPHKYGTVERTFSEHQSSAFASMPVSDYTTLPDELKAGSLKMAYEAATAAVAGGNYADGDVRTFSCQTCHMPPVQGQGCNFDFAPERVDLPLHNLTGANSFAPEAIAYLDTVGSGLTFAGGMNPMQLSALADGAVRAKQTVQSAASLRVNGSELEVVNLTGHKLPSGYPEGRRMWLRYVWEDAGGNVIEVDGADQDIVVNINGTPTDVFDVLDIDAADTQIWDVKHGITQDWAVELIGQGLPASLPVAYNRITGAVEETLGGVAAMAPGSAHESFHFAINNTVLSDNRIPPYGMRHDDALERNCRPIPADQFGDPGAGGVYDHVDRLPFNPPAGAAHCTISLMYQSVSWEYAWFLYNANDGSVAHLADTGDKLMEAYLAVGPAAGPTLMAEIEWFAPWFDMGFAHAGVSGDPLLVMTGAPLDNERILMTLSNALPSAPTYLVAGAGFANLPAFGGTLVPNFEAPLGVIVVLATNGSGGISINQRWPAGVPAGLNFSVQAWIEDPAASRGFAASNAVAATSL